MTEARCLKLLSHVEMLPTYEQVFNNKVPFTPQKPYFMGDGPSLSVEKFEAEIGSLQLKDTVEAKGRQVNPEDIEDVLRRHHDVTDAAVVDVEDAIVGEHPLAFVVTSSHNMSSHDREKLVIAFEESVRSQLDESCWLRKQIRIVEELPKSQGGKVLKRVLGAKAQQCGLESLRRDRKVVPFVFGRHSCG